MSINNKRINQFNTDEILTGNELILIMSDGVTKNMELTTVKDFVLSGESALSNLGFVINPNVINQDIELPDNSIVYHYGEVEMGSGYTLTIPSGTTLVILDDVSNTDIYITGGTYNAGIATFTNNTGDIFTVSGFTTGSGSGSGDSYWISGSTGNYSIKANNNSGLDATGNYAVAEGSGTTASGVYSHAEGLKTIASGSTSHAEGRETISGGLYSHAEGYKTTALSEGSHVEGRETTTLGQYSHAEGYKTTAINSNSHAEGSQTIASGSTSHAEGFLTTSGGLYSHAEGYKTTTISDGSHAEGRETTARGINSHAQGYLSQAIGDASHAGGYYTKASGNYSFAHGYNSHATGTTTIVFGDNITGTTANTVYVPDLVIKKLASIPANSADAIGENGSVTWDNNYFYWKANNQWLRLSGLTF